MVIKDDCSTFDHLKESTLVSREFCYLALAKTQLNLELQCINRNDQVFLLKILHFAQGNYLFDLLNLHKKKSLSFD